MHAVVAGVAKSIHKPCWCSKDDLANFIPLALSIVSSSTLQNTWVTSTIIFRLSQLHQCDQGMLATK